MNELFIFLAVWTGVGLAYLLPLKNWPVKLLMAFSGAYILGLILLEFFPKYIYSDTAGSMAPWVLVGVLIQLVLESLTKGLEHGHSHAHSTSFNLMLFGLTLHAFIEGLAGEVGGDNYLKLILVHKIPISIVFGSFVLALDKSITFKILYILIFALATPIAYRISHLVSLEKPLVFIGISTGVFLHISTTIIFESSQHHRMDYKRLLVIIFGLLSAYFSIYSL